VSQRAWSAAWAIWAATVLISFSVLEGLALSRRSHPTLSRTLARWLGVAPPTPWGRVALVGFAGFWTWLTVHVARIR
jgi:hypothetical protein